MSKRAKRLASKAAILIVCGLAAFATGAIVVHAATSAQTAAAKKKAQPSFYVRAQFTDQLAPGKTVPLKLSIANNRTRNIWITRMAVQLKMDQAHQDAGCNLPRDYRIVQLPRKFFPYKLAKAKQLRSKKKLKLKYRSIPAKKTNGKPALMMVSLPNVNQDVCKGATLTIGFLTRSSTKKPRWIVRKPGVAR